MLLVVEDEPLLLGLATKLCHRLGYRTLTASDAQAALEVLEGDDEVDLLLTDVILPGGMDGAQLAVRAREVRPGLPVLFMSGYAHHSVLRQAEEVSGFDLLSKPFDSVSLALKVQEALKGGGLGD